MLKDGQKESDGIGRLPVQLQFSAFRDRTGRGEVAGVQNVLNEERIVGGVEGNSHVVAGKEEKHKKNKEKKRKEEKRKSILSYALDQGLATVGAHRMRGEKDTNRQKKGPYRGFKDFG